MKAVLILSGGIDSSTLAYYLNQNGYDELICITFNYGQKQVIELESAKKIAHHLNATHHIIDISFMGKFLHGTGLTDSSIPVPHGAYTKENMAITVVPNRNTMLLSMGWSIACVEKADVLAFGAQSGDNYVYPDTRTDYLNALNLALRLGTEDCRRDNLELTAPFIKKSKSEVITIGHALKVPYADTWSCYDGMHVHCGQCGACQNRIQGFRDASLLDPTK